MSGWAAVVQAVSKAAEAGLNQYNASKAYRNSVRSAKHSHQWEVADLQKAGLNPILSANNGSSGVNAPMASSGDMDFGSGLLQQAQLDNLEAQNANLQAQNKQLAANTAKTAEEAVALGLRNDWAKRNPSENDATYASGINMTGGAITAVSKIIDAGTKAFTAKPNKSPRYADPGGLHSATAKPVPSFTVTDDWNEATGKKPSIIESWKNGLSNWLNSLWSK